MKTRTLAFALPLAILGAVPAAAQGDFSAVEIKAEKVADGLYALTGRGGNLGLSVGEDGAYLIDDQYAPLTGKILAAVKELTPEPVRFVVNTHYHGDHTGGNENMGEAGALLVAHENVRARMAAGTFMKAFNRQVEPAPAGALPVVTFTDAVTFHWNGEEIRVFFVGPAHTDGDSIIHFVKADVFHMGDTLFNGMYPFIDVSGGGRLEGRNREDPPHRRARPGGHEDRPPGVPRHARRGARPRSEAQDRGQDRRADRRREAHRRLRREVGWRLHEAGRLGGPGLRVHEVTRASRAVAGHPERAGAGRRAKDLSVAFTERFFGPRPRMRPSE
jgi:glyoxylase-like metal-dependent hydrolase (beta-lactamase superfamily II)